MHNHFTAENTTGLNEAARDTLNVVHAKVLKRINEENSQGMYAELAAMFVFEAYDDHGLREYNAMADKAMQLAGW